MRIRFVVLLSIVLVLTLKSLDHTMEHFSSTREFTRSSNPEFLVGGATRYVDFFNEMMLNRISEYLFQQVPEIKHFSNFIAKRDSAVHFVYYIESYPDPKSSNPYKKEYYEVYVGESHTDHQVRWNTFLVRKDFNGILVRDHLNFDVITLEQWRRNKDTQQ